MEILLWIKSFTVGHEIDVSVGKIAPGDWFAVGLDTLDVSFF